MLLDPAKYSLKRAAWAYGCAKKGSAQELALYDVLRAKVIESLGGGIDRREPRVLGAPCAPTVDLDGNPEGLL